MKAITNMRLARCFWLTMCVCVPAMAHNLLPNASFELGLSGRDYNGGGLFTVDDTQGYHGTRSLVVSNRWGGMTRYGMKSRMFQAAAGVHTFSFYARAVSTNVTAATNATITINLCANPFACNRELPGVEALVRISGSEWRRYTVKGELAPSNGGWYWLQLALDHPPEGGGKVWIDAIMLNAGAEALPFATRQPVEYALQMTGDFTRIYVSNDGLPPIRVLAANGGEAPADKALELKIMDFRQRPVFATNFVMRVPAQAVLTREIAVKLDQIGPLRAELYEADGLIQDELIFSVVPKIEHPVLATQFASGEPGMRHMYKSLGFKYAGQHNGPQWCGVQPKGPDEWDQQALKNMDAHYEALKGNFESVSLTPLWLEPEWVQKWPEEKDLPFRQARHRNFPLKQYLDYVEAMARRYPEWNYYHVMNEPWGWDPADYVTLLEHVRRRFDSVRSGIKILAPNSYPRMTGWTESFIAAGGLKYTDVLTQHIYTGGGGDSLEALNILRKWAAADGNTNRPIWNTETALHPYHIMTWYTMFMPANIGSWADGGRVPDCNPAEQGAERWAKMYLMQTAMGVSRYFSHVAPGGYAELPRFAHMLHAEPDGGRQPVAIAWAVAGNMVGETTGGGELAVSPHLTALSYTRGDTVIIALWMKNGKGPAEVFDPLAAGLFRPYAEAAAQHRGRLRVIDPYAEYSFLMPSGARAFAASDMFGNPLPMQTAGDRMKLPISRLPIYLQTKQLTPKTCADLLAQGEIEGLMSFKSYAEIGRTSSQEAGLLVDVASAIPKTISVTSAVTRLPPGFEVVTQSGRTTLPPQQKRRIEFPFTRMALPLEGQGDFTVVLTDGKNETALKQPPAWLAPAARRSGIVVDGNLADWEGIPAIHLGKSFQVINRPEAWSGPADSNARLRFAWDDTNLYVAAEVVDDQVHDTARSYGGECVELFLNMRLFENQDDTTLGPQTRQYFLNPPVVGAWPTGIVSAVGQIEGGRLAGQRTEQGYRMEAVIPLVNLQSAGLVARPGGAIGLQPTLCDYDAKDKNGCKLVWTGKPKEYLDTSGWGRLVFLGDAPDRLLRKGDEAAGAKRTLSAWNFDRADRLDDSGGAGFVGVVTNAVCREPGTTNAHLFFDGSSSSVSVRQGRWDVKRKRFEIRFKADPDYRRPTLLWLEHVAPGWRYLGRITPEGRLTVGLYLHQKPTIELVSRTIVRRDGAWIDAAYEWDAERGRMALYVNGVKEAEQEGVVIQQATENLWVGGVPEENAWFRGGIQKVGIFRMEDGQ